MSVAPSDQRRAGRERLGADLESGVWEERYGHLRALPSLDVGLRLVSIPCAWPEPRD